MAFQVKYRIEFDDQRELAWKIDISTDPWAGAITDLVATGNPLTFYMDNDSDELTSPIKPSFANISIHSQTNFAYLELNEVEEREILVQIYAGGVIYWTGFLEPGGYTESYDQPPYTVTLNAGDGLKALEKIPFLDGSGDPITGRATEVVILRTIFGKIYPYLIDFYEYVNIYDDLMNSTTADSPMDQAELEQKVFLDMNCYQVLTHILVKYNACIRQVDKYRIYRPIELKQATVYGRYWTGDTTKASTNYAPLQEINRTTSVTNIQQVPGGVLMTQGPVAKVISDQDYGDLESWLAVWEFNPEDYIVGGYTFNNWTRLSACWAFPLEDYDIGEKVGAIITSKNTYPTLSTGISQEFGSKGIATTQTCSLEFEYMFYNQKGSSVSGNIQPLLSTFLPLT